MNEITVKKRVFTEEEIKALNKKYKPLSIEERIKELYKDFDVTEVMLTSSFAATSAFLLKLFSDVNKKQKVFFIDTGYHFDETLNYKKELTKKYGLNVKSISAIKEEHEFTTKDETWRKNPDFCCSINKVRPLETIKKNYSVWVSGLMEWQSDHRSTLNIFEERGEILKFYPLLDVTKEERDKFIEEHQLPFHPLVAKDYNSIGCTHCTVPGEDRSGRWNNNPKTECGLHL
ncbi:MULTISPECIES: phosphoadenylyl-sulfate reductase [Mesonia]|uniref:Phosphoadenosine phosphosulfate reductase n=1 Tax=Mesonia oceanica TaxID=2687242 RepID=A0AC61Y5Z9_9FLAO|nr:MULTISPECIES: phosphoadenylyl-sulfate reductase [Mesonia]MAN27223.1 phosphoadenylyl-sulfate reductase [Mesonia sp.]MAQ42381.1 phosphoadenylyl-sulfate reductase [Mesonia sp.]MBJ98669.1 phosphoadenylyl-sulfate reductase [Flavobacteriaceae bacterium]VVU99913.1 putative phosphoadenosine phosphosulfate reductase [Mesonia oceanica]|tara:strand:- start:113855 stop:114547 length:693 start_codon:yes stop_codon:yes gene_type:complete